MGIEDLYKKIHWQKFAVKLTLVKKIIRRLITVENSLIYLNLTLLYYKILIETNLH